MEAQDLIDKLVLIDGVGNYAEHKACIMSACVAKWRLERGEDLGSATDEIECVCPTICQLAIGINDTQWWASDEERTATLKPFMDKILNTRNPDLIVKRATLCADRAARVFAPLALESGNMQEEAAYAAKWAADAADAAECAAYAADAAERIKYAAIAAANAADAAKCAAYAADAATIKGEALQLLSDLCDMSEEA